MTLYHMVWRHLGRQFVECEADLQSSERISSPTLLSCMSHIVIRFHSPALQVRQNPRNELQTHVEL